jgi:hypothetical protein
MIYTLKRNDYLRFGFTGSFGGAFPLTPLGTLPDEKFAQVDELIQKLQSPDKEMEPSFGCSSGLVVLVTDQAKRRATCQMTPLFSMKAFEPAPKAFLELGALLYPRDDTFKLGATTSTSASPTRTARMDKNLSGSRKPAGFGAGGAE